VDPGPIKIADMCDRTKKALVKELFLRVEGKDTDDQACDVNVGNVEAVVVGEVEYY